MTDSNNISLRPVDDDREFLLRTYASSREIELSMIPWEDEQKRLFVEHQLDAQTSYYREKHPQATHDIILFKGDAAGRLYIDRTESEIAILDINVLPEFRRNGIATGIVSDLKAESAGRSVRVYVEIFNPSQKLFAELGFTVESQTETHILFRWSDTV
jgi:ribosomal protein S18 acetylase RimI-like enzyme